MHRLWVSFARGQPWGDAGTPTPEREPPWTRGITRGLRGVATDTNKQTPGWNQGDENHGQRDLCNSAEVSADKLGQLLPLTWPYRRESCEVVLLATLHQYRPQGPGLTALLLGWTFPPHKTSQPPAGLGTVPHTAQPSPCGPGCPSPTGGMSSICFTLEPAGEFGHVTLAIVFISAFAGDNYWLVLSTWKLPFVQKTDSSRLWGGDVRCPAVSGLSKPQTVPHALFKSCHPKAILNDACQELSDQACNWVTASEASRWKNITQSGFFRPLLEKAEGNCHATNHKGVMTKLHSSPVFSWCRCRHSGTEGVWPPCHSAALWFPPCSSSSWADGMGENKQSPSSRTPLSKKSLEINSVSAQRKPPVTRRHRAQVFSLLTTERAILPLTAVWAKQAASPGALWVMRVTWGNGRQGPEALLAESLGVGEGRPQGGARALLCACGPGTLDNISEPQSLWVQNGSKAYFKGCFED